MQIERTNANALIVNRLPDGSRVMTDRKNEVVFALNPTAGAAWDACAHPTTLAAMTEDMQRTFDSATTAEHVEEAVLQLQEQKLVRTSSGQTSRRSFLTALSAAAVPLVVSLSIADQRAYARRARSAPPPRPLPPVPVPKPTS